jgi:hypothetical protein
LVASSVFLAYIIVDRRTSSQEAVKGTGEEALADNILILSRINRIGDNLQIGGAGGASLPRCAPIARAERTVGEEHAVFMLLMVTFFSNVFFICPLRLKEDR